MEENKIEALLDELASPYIANPRKNEIGNILEKNRDLKNALIERVQAVNYLSKDCSSYIQDYECMEFNYHKKIIHATIAEDIIDNFLHFQEEVSADPIVISISQENYQGIQKPAEMVRRYMEALDKTGLLAMKKELILHFDEINKVYLQYASQKDILNVVEDFAPKMKELQSLTITSVKNIQNTLYATIPSFKENENLKSLTVNGFAMDALKDLSVKMPHLESLELSHSKRRDGSYLYQMSSYTLSVSEIKNFPKLKVLTLSDVDLKEIPKEIFSLKNLEKLDVSSNQIKELPSILEYKGVKTLVLDKNELTSTEHLPCTTLRELSMRHNKVSKLDSQFAGLMVLNDMMFGGKEMVSIKMHGNPITLDSLPTQTWKNLGEVIEIDKIAKCLNFSFSEKEKLIQLFPTVSQNKSLTL